MTTTELMQVEDLHVTFPVYGGVLRHRVAGVRAVDGISFDLHEGEVLGLVGESGSGKTTVGRAMINLLRFTSPDVELSGQIRFGRPPADLNGLPRSAMLPFRAQIQMIFQDPYASLNPRMTVQQIVEGPLRIHTRQSADERRATVADLLDRVGLQSAYAERFPHEFSGGQRQRIGIARALATHPKLLIADEPVSALDVSVQAQVINLMQELKEEFGLTYLFIAHDLSVVQYISDRIAVMYLGNIVEIGPADQVYADPRHPYTRALISAVPKPDPRKSRRDRIRLEGDIPTPLNKPSGCGFRTRCPIARPSCADAVPPLVDVGGGQRVACPHHAELDPPADPGLPPKPPEPSPPAGVGG
ncbi:MAG TPA: ATP-binding cassette domain-containing protein [Deltaproteobacteria bacterium]|nr:ATP-binding cassette domain-containing protein [Deltaproteobacteria bacterium]